MSSLTELQATADLAAAAVNTAKKEYYGSLTMFNKALTDFSIQLNAPPNNINTEGLQAAASAGAAASTAASAAVKDNNNKDLLIPYHTSLTTWHGLLKGLYENLHNTPPLVTADEDEKVGGGSSRRRVGNSKRRRPKSKRRSRRARKGRKTRRR